jgi:DNA replication protein DnaC
MPYQPEKITKQDILKAAEYINKDIHKPAPSLIYDVIINGKSYAPKEILRIAHQLATGESPGKFYGGEQTNKWLRELGFEITTKKTVNYYVVGAFWSDGDQTQRFLENSIWENGYEDKFTDVVKRVRPNDRIAIKSSFATKEGGSYLRIKALGTVTENIGNGKILKVKWDPPFKLYDLEGYGGYRNTIQQLPTEDIEAIFSIENNKNSSMKMPPLNTILYGPPGTGKTYNTIRKAAEIITGELYETNKRYEAAKQLFRDELGKQIEFVTFHQNYSYEDFVAGLRPDVESASVGLRFVEHKGIFYKLCQRARENYQQHSSGQTFVEPTFEEVLDVFLQPLLEDEEIEIATIARSVTFHITANNGKNLAFRKQGGGTQHTLSIATLKDLYEDKREYHLQGLGIYFRPVVDRLKKLSKEMRKETGKIDLKNYVLIIDEINRANISRVFGELITLLEPDKRIGNKHELKLRLPGLPEEELFGIPPNLYIVGTMNTADKSIALIDIALRRRFVFEPMYPNPELVIPEYKQFFLELNSFIFKAKGADFLIGHSYLMPEEDGIFDFVTAMNNKIIPLLNEYFYNNRSTTAYSLLNGVKAHITGCEFVEDLYIGVVCKPTSA